MLAYIASKAGRAVMPPESQKLLQTCEEEVAPIIRRVARRVAIARRHIVAAADQCQEFYLRKFLAEGVCPNDHIHGWTPLLKLCGQSGYREREDVEEVLACVDAVLEAGADVNLGGQFHFRMSPLELAAGLKPPWETEEPRPMPRVVARLIKAGVDVASVAGRRALQRASYCTSDSYSHKDSYLRDAVAVVNLLIEGGLELRGKTLDQLYYGLYHPDSLDALVEGYFPDDRITALLLSAGARLEPSSLPSSMLRSRYVRQVIMTGGFEAYERKQAKALVAMLTPKFPQLPEELIPIIVKYAFRPGMYYVRQSE